MDLRIRPFAEQVEHYLQQEDKRGPMLWMGNTPPCLLLLGFPELPLRMPLSVLHKIHTGKGGEREGVKKRHLVQLPELIDEPLAIFDSATIAGALVVLTSARNPSGLIIASIEANRTDANTQVNLITSAYSKTGEHWVSQQIASGRLRYADKEKGFDTLEVSGNTLNCVAEPGSQNPSGVKILLPEDIRNFRAERRANKLPVTLHDET